ncbi:hypothetical protein K9M79_06950 [Candidatus Woesearchaeota archaeon]|nr:hypothetical protein [Candidatus Woesearchaeota archaeon]
MTDNELEQELDDDEISAGEEGFLRGYENDAEDTATKGSDFIDEDVEEESE